MFLQALLPLGMLCMALVNLLQAVSHQELVVACGEDRGGDVDQNRDPRVRAGVRESLAAKEDGGDDPSAKIPGEIRRDRVSGEAPDHRGVRDADGKRNRLRADERICGIKARPDDDTDVAVNEELLEEQETLVGLVRVWERAQDAGDATVVHGGAMLVQVDCLCCLDLGPVARHQHQSSHERSKNLRKNVMRHFLPGKSLPDCEADWAI